MKVNWVRLVISLLVGFISALGKEDDFLANNSIAILAILTSLYILICTLMIKSIQIIHQAFDNASNKENYKDKTNEVIKTQCVDKIGYILSETGLGVLLLTIQATLFHYLKYDWLSMITHTIVNSYIVWLCFELYFWVVNLFDLIGHVSAKDKQNHQDKY